MSSPTPNTKMSTRAITALSDLAIAVADYETAWRLSIDDRSDVPQDFMRSAHAEQKRARDILIEEFGDPQVVHAIEGALVISAARPEGIRPPDHRQADSSFASRGEARKFVSNTIDDFGIV